MKRPLALLLIGAMRLAAAQCVSATTDGAAFANSLAPTSASQVVNPAGVNATAWGNSTATATTVPLGLGGFSNPTTSNATITSARSIGLGALGNQAVDQCANFVPTASSDPLQVQACAAVNFLTNRCMTATGTQAAVMEQMGLSQTTGTNCAGTYGQGVQNFNMSSQVSGTDTMFSVMHGLKSTAGTTTGAACAPQSVQTAPPEYTLNSCVKDSNVTAQSCSQNLNVAVLPAQSNCPTDRPLVREVVERPGSSVDVVTVDASCSPTSGVSNIPFSFFGFGLRGGCTPAISAGVDMSQPQPQGANPPPLLGTITPNWLYQCIPMVVAWTGSGCPACTGEACKGLTCSANFHFVSAPGITPTYGCPSGYTQDQTCTDNGDGTSICTPAATCSTGCLDDGSGNLSSCTTIAANTTGWAWIEGGLHITRDVTFPVPVTLPATATATWSDACTQFEASAGITLPIPPITVTP